MTMKSKKSGGYAPKCGLVLRPAHERLEDREEDAAVLGHPPLGPDLGRVDPHERIFGERRERVVRLVGEDVAVREEQDARAPAAHRELRFQRLWKSFHAIWNATSVLPVPVAIVSRMRCLPSATAERTRSIAMSW